MAASSYFWKRSALVRLLLLAALWPPTSLCITVPKDYPQFSARALGRTLAHCLGQSQRWACLEAKLLDTLDQALHDNSTWHYGDFMAVERSAEPADVDAAGWRSPAQTRQQRSLSDRIGDKLLLLARARSIRLKLPTPDLQTIGSGISDALDDVQTLVTHVAPAPPPSLPAPDTGAAGDEGRKKKDKDKHMAMMGGMTLMAMLAQMFLGKVILIAGAAFVMAKIALLISVLGSLKKSQGGGGGGGGTDHVIVTSGGGGGGGHGHDHGSSSGWHRSMPYDYTKLEVVEEDGHDHDHDHDVDVVHDAHDSHDASEPPAGDEGDDAAPPPGAHGGYSYKSPGGHDFRRRQTPTSGFL